MSSERVRLFTFSSSAMPNPVPEVAKRETSPLRERLRVLALLASSLGGLAVLAAVLLFPALAWVVGLHNDEP